MPAAPRYVEVAVNSGRPQRGTFTYAIPPLLAVRVGDGVFVPFGRQVLQGIVLALTESPAVAAPRPILALLGEERLLGPEQTALVRWIGDAYLAPAFAAAALFLPPGFERKPERLLRPAPLSDASALQYLSERERTVLDAITARRSVEADALQAALKDGAIAPTVRSLVKKGLVEERYALSRPTVGPKTETLLSLAIEEGTARAAIAAWPRSRRSRQADLLERLQVGAAPRDEARRLAGARDSLERWLRQGRLMVPDGDCVRLAVDPAAVDSAIASLRRTGPERRQVALLEALLPGPRAGAPARQEANATGADVDALIADGLVRRQTRVVARDPLAGRAVPIVAAPALTEDQGRAYEAIAEALDRAVETRPQHRKEGPIFLLHGVTGSGKTEVYLAAVEHARDQGGWAIVLVPEIALTPQTVDRFLARLPGRVAVLHSGLSAGELHDQWERVRSGDADVVIGSRSALFAPHPLPGSGGGAERGLHLALIIVDEEHEWTYKQTDPAPRYRVREVVEEYCRLTGAVAVLGSATPDVVTATRARAGQYRYLELPERVRRTDPADPASPLETAALPSVEIVDMREELVRGNRSIFSEPLAAAMTTALERDEQVILFLNRRGVATFVCRTCGEARGCDRCSIPFTYHRALPGLEPGPPGAGDILRCHECGRTAQPEGRCPHCGSDRVRPMGIGTQRVEEEVAKTFPRARPLRWDRDTVAGKDGHRRVLEQFIRGDANVLVGTQMIAKGLDLPAVTVVGVVNADLSLRLPDYTGPERTFQLITQVTGRAGRGPQGGRVVVQTYAPEHYAIRAAAGHDYEAFYAAEVAARSRHDYPPLGRLARLVYADRKPARARDVAANMAASLLEDRDRRGLLGPEVLGPTPAFLARRRGLYRWQITLRGADPLPLLRPVDFGRGWTVDIDPVSLL